METMPYRPELDRPEVGVQPAAALYTPSQTISTDWRDRLPMLTGATVRNGRGNGALRKIGAVQEGLLRKSFCKDGEYCDQALWTILDEDWRAATVWNGSARLILH